MAIKYNGRLWLWHSKPTEMRWRLYYWFSIAAFNLELVRLSLREGGLRLTHSIKNSLDSLYYIKTYCDWVSVFSSLPPPLSPWAARGTEKYKNWVFLSVSQCVLCQALSYLDRTKWALWIFAAGRLVLFWGWPSLCPVSRRVSCQQSASRPGLTVLIHISIRLSSSLSSQADPISVYRTPPEHWELTW